MIPDLAELSTWQKLGILIGKFIFLKFKLNSIKKYSKIIN